MHGLSTEDLPFCDECFQENDKSDHYPLSQIRPAGSFQRYCFLAKYRERGSIRYVFDACDVQQHSDASLLENHT